MRNVNVEDLPPCTSLQVELRVSAGAWAPRTSAVNQLAAIPVHSRKLKYGSKNTLFIHLFFYSHLRTFFHCFQRERKGERERDRCEREASTGCLPYVPGPGTACTRTGDRICNLGMCPDWESNLQPFAYGTMLQLPEPTPARARTHILFANIK